MLLRPTVRRQRRLRCSCGQPRWADHLPCSWLRKAAAGSNHQFCRQPHDPGVRTHTVVLKRHLQVIGRALSPWTGYKLAAFLQGAIDMVQMRLHKPDPPAHSGLLGWHGDAARLPQLLTTFAAEPQPVRAAQATLIQDYLWQDRGAHVELRIRAMQLVPGAIDCHRTTFRGGCKCK